MNRPASRHPWLLVASALFIAAATGESQGIEMFTYFGDGSRIGLPSLEVPIEAYPGIPLRSDRLRARRRAMRMGAGAVVATPQPGQAPGITIRTMPQAEVVQPATPRVAAPRTEPAVSPAPMPPEPPVEAIPAGDATAQ